VVLVFVLDAVSERMTTHWFFKSYDSPSPFSIDFLAVMYAQPSEVDSMQAAEVHQNQNVDM